MVDLLIQQRDELESAVSAASAKLKAFARLPNGLTPDAVAATDEYKAAKAEYSASFNQLRQFNQKYARLIRKGK